MIFGPKPFSFYAQRQIFSHLYIFQVFSHLYILHVFSHLYILHVFSHLYIFQVFSHLYILQIFSRQRFKRREKRTVSTLEIMKQLSNANTFVNASNRDFF